MLLEIISPPRPFGAAGRLQINSRLDLARIAGEHAV
jgi:hypothetical protein